MVESVSEGLNMRCITDRIESITDSELKEKLIALRNKFVELDEIRNRISELEFDIKEMRTNILNQYICEFYSLDGTGDIWCAKKGMCIDYCYPFFCAECNLIKKESVDR